MQLRLVALAGGTFVVAAVAASVVVGAFDDPGNATATAAAGPAVVHHLADADPTAGWSRTDVSSVLGVNDAIVPLAGVPGAESASLWKAFNSCVAAHGGVSDVGGPYTDAPPPTPPAFVACANERGAAQAYTETTAYRQANSAAEAQAKLVWPCLTKAGIAFDSAGDHLMALRASKIDRQEFKSTLTACRSAAASAVARANAR